MLSLSIYTLLYPWGLLTGRPYPEAYLWSETRFFFESLFILVGLEWYLLRSRELFGLASRAAPRDDSGRTVQSS